MGLLDKIYEHSPAFVQNLGVSYYGLKLHLREYGRPLEEALDDLARTEKFSAAELAAFQDEKLRALIEHAYRHVPYYHRVMDEHKLSPADIRTAADLPKLPVLTRQDVEQYAEELLATNYNKAQLIPGGTGGTTGAPLRFFWDKRTCLYKTAVDWRQKRWAGIDIGDRMALFWGRILVPPDQKKPPFWRYNWIHKQLFFSCYHLSAENLPAYIRKMRSFGAVAIEGYPSTVYIIARFLLSRNETLPLTAAFTSSETLYPHQREAIEQAFECKLFDFYGMAERVIFATECSAHEGHHINSDYGITEILDTDNQAVAPGEMGRIVGTGLYNYAMPLIRYVSSDVSGIQQRQCSCGRAFPLMHEVTTRAEDMITATDGRYISFASMTLPLKISDQIEASQIIQEDKNHIVLRLVRRPGYSDTDSALLVAEFRKRLGSDMNVAFDFVDDIPRTRSGKFRFVISKVPLEF